MAEFIVGNPLRKLARRHEFLRAFLWRLDYLLIWTVFKLSKLMPVDAGSRFGNWFGKKVGPRLKSKSAIFRRNLATAFPELGAETLDQLVTRAWGQAGRVLTEYAHLEHILNDPKRLEIDIREHIETYSDPSRPCVIVTAHLSNWEVVCSAMAKMGIPNTSLYSPPTNPLLDRLLLDSRKALNCQLLPRENAARPLFRAIREGRTAAMVMDRRIEDGSPIRFFGTDKPSTILPAKLALKSGLELVPVQVERIQDAHFRVTFHPPVRPSQPDADENARAVDMIQQVHAQFEDWIRQNPQDWFCSKRIWSKGKIAPSKETGADADVDSYAA